MNKIKNLFLPLLLLASLRLCAQIEDYSLRFQDYTPKWLHVVVDSSYIGTKYYNGVEHLWMSLRETIFEDTAFYKTYINYRNGWQGAFVEKVGLRDGKTLWTAAYDLRTLDDRELPGHQYLDGDGHLVILGYKAVSPPPIPNYFWPDGKFTKRSYDLRTGALEDYRYGAKRDTNATTIYLVPTRDQAYLFPLDEARYLYVQNDGSQSFKNSYMDEDGLRIKDTLIRVPESIYQRSVSFNIIRIAPDSFMTLFHNIKFDNGVFTPDSFLLQVHYYDKEWNRVRTVDLKDKVGPALVYYLLEADGETYVIYKSVGDYGSDKTLLIFDHRWNLVDSIQMISALNPARSQHVKLPHDQGYLFVTTTKKPSQMKFYKSDAEGNIKHVRTLDMLAPNVKVENMYALEDGDIILVCQLYYPKNTDKREPNYNQFNIVRIDGKDLGIKTATSEPEQEEKMDYRVENPVRDGILRIRFDANFTGKLAVMDATGKTVSIYAVEERREAAIPLKHLAPGNYLIHPKDSNVKAVYQSKKIIVLP